MVSVHRSKMALAATAEFWHSPISQADDSSNDNQPAMSQLPAMHHQLLSKDTPSFTELTGHDHTQISVGYDDLDGYQTSDSESSFCCRQKLSAVKREGGGSWLLGFARIHEKVTTSEPQDDEDMTPPGLLRVPSRDSFSDSSCDDSDDDSSTATPTKRRAGVSFSECVKVQPVPHACTLSPLQRRKMYSSCFEVRQNKIRNKKEYRYDGYDWRNITEEWEMGVDMVTGELVHPVHDLA